MKRALSIMLCLLLLASYVPVWSTPSAEAAASLPYSEGFEGGAWSEGPLLPSLGAAGDTTSTITNSITLNDIKLTSTILQNLISTTALENLNGEVVATDEGKALRLTDKINASKGNISSLFTFAPQALSASSTEVLVMEWAFKTNPLDGGHTNSARFRLANGANNARPVSIETNNGILRYRNAVGALADFYPQLTFINNDWYNVRLEINLAASVYNIIVTDKNNNTYTASSVGFQATTAADIGGLDVNTGDGAKMEMFIDNLNVYTQPLAVATPTGVAAEAGNAKVDLSWNTVTGATYYSVKRSGNNTSGGLPYTTVATNVMENRYSDTAVTNGTKYFYVITAANENGESFNSVEVNATPIAIDAPTNLQATAGNAKVDLSWDAVSGATGYKVKRSTSAGGPYTEVGTATEVSFTDNTAANGTTYYYVVTAMKSTSESLNSNQVSATPIAPALPAAPTGLAALANDGQITITWKAVLGADSYNVKRSETSGGTYVPVATNVVGTSFTDTGLTNGTAYYYVVSATNELGTGVDSVEIADKPRAFLINENFESSTLGAVPNGFTVPFGSGSITEFTATNNTTVINNSNLTNSYNNTSLIIDGNDTNVLWINDGVGRGGFNKAFTPVTAESEKGITAQLRFMEPETVGDSYVIELMDSGKKLILSLKFDFPPEKFQAKKWYTVKYVADVKANTAELFIDYHDGKGMQYIGNYGFSAPATEIASLNFRMAGTTAKGSFVDDIVVYQQEVTTPQKLIAEGGNERVALRWNPASGAEAYNVYRSEAVDGEYVQVASNVPTNSYMDTHGIINFKPYFYKVTAIAAAGESEFSNYSQALPNDIAPPSGEITGLKATVREGQLTISWDAVPPVKDEAIYYILERGTTPAGPFIKLLEGDQERITSTSYLDKNLTNGTEYYYKLTAWNMGGEGPSKLLEKVAPLAPIDAPKLLSADAGDGEVTLSWSAVTSATSYQVKRSTKNGLDYETLTLDVQGTSYTDTTAVNGQTYYYVVAAANDKQVSMISNQLKAKPYVPVAGAPAKPTGFKAAAHEGKVSLSWNAVSDATAYVVKRAPAGSEAYAIVATVSQTAFEDTNVTNGTTYQYVVAAQNDKGQSPETDELLVLPAKVLIVDKNATANGTTVFNTVQSAVNAVPSNNTERTVIYIAPGLYHEKLVVDRPYVSLVGAGMDETIIEYGDYAGTSATTGQPGHTGNTFLSQTVAVTADFFTAANLTIENSAGPRSKVAQAVALSLKSDQAVFESVKLIGYQDTLYNGLNGNNAGRHYFRNSIIQGDVDFIFGEAPAVVMENVKMVLVSHTGGGGHITAGAQRNVTDQGYVFFNSQIVDDASAQGVYDLGRPWKDYARVSFINTFINSEKFLPSGWVASCAGSCKTSYFSEYNSYGPGANASARTIATQLTGEEASITVPQIFGGWNPSIPVIMPGVSYLPTVSATTAVFDKNAVKQADIYVTVNSNGHSLTSIKHGASELPASAYEATGSGYVVKKGYLAGLAEGTVTLNFIFGDHTVPLMIKVTDTSVTDLGKQVLATNDGWASHTTGTTGGSTASAANIFTVTNRAELIAAVAGNNPKIVYVKGTIDMNVDDNNQPVGRDYYAVEGYDFEQYLAAYDPEVWGKKLPAGPLEAARAASAKNQGDRIKINVGSNTTLVGLPGSNAKILGGNVNLDKVDNIIIRNIEFANTFDHFPQWDPTDGEFGNWNSAYDSISVKGSTHVWVDHNTFSDEGGLDDQSHKYFGRKFQQHDGALDITNGSDLVTVSYNYFHDHDKTNLIGGSDSTTTDAGKLRITFHHNYYKNIGQRAPRVRYGQVHVYNNLYEGSVNHARYPFLYAIGVGYESQVYAQNNYFSINSDVKPEAMIQVSSGNHFTDMGSMLNGQNVKIAESFGGLTGVNWEPKLFLDVDPTAKVPQIVKENAGTFDSLAVVPEERNDDPQDSISGPIGAPSVVIPPSQGNEPIVIEQKPVLEKTESGKMILTVTLDSNTMQKAIEALNGSEGSAPRIEVPVQGNESAAKVQVPASAVASAYSKAPEAVLAMNFGAFTYNLPVKAIDSAALAQKLGVKAEDMTISVSIEKVTGAVASKVAEQSKQQGMAPVSDTVEFNVTIEANGQSISLNDFGSTYVARDVQIDRALDADKLTAVLYNPETGSFSFVPAIIKVANGKTTVTVKRPGNSMYTVVETSAKAFADLNSHWAKADVELLASKLVVQGVSDKSFAPDQSITRAEFAALLVRGLGLTEVQTNAYADVKANDWFAGSVGAAAQAGLVEGFEDGTFRPAAPITREQMAVMISRALEFAGKQGAGKASLSFADSSTVSVWAKAAVSDAVSAGIINGMSDGTFQPAKQASRAEATVMLKRFLQAVEFINK
jgi:pectate lyase/pectin methylesterase-like acyl-CoA thioesterase